MRQKSRWGSFLKGYEKQRSIIAQCNQIQTKHGLFLTRITAT